MQIRHADYKSRQVMRDSLDLTVDNEGDDARKLTFCEHKQASNKRKSSHQRPLRLANPKRQQSSHSDRVHVTGGFAVTIIIQNPTGRHVDHRFQNRWARMDPCPSWTEIVVAWHPMRL